MSFIYDRLYGRLLLPNLIAPLLECPGLLRLRAIGMGNVDFLNFPSFSAVKRYEHSLGVCHLANLAAKALSLSEKDLAELVIAALYHDVTTPPFAHLMEEFIRPHFDFDHERKPYELLTGKSSELGHIHTQVYQGRRWKLPEFCQSAPARSLGIDLYRIIRLIEGTEDDELACLINGDMDLDNIDNVVRAAGAMGIREASGTLAENLARSFIWFEKNIALLPMARDYVKQWKWLRRTVYDMILCSEEDFCLQTMLKHCLQHLMESDDEKLRLREEDWKLTEVDVTERIRLHPEASEIYQRMLLKDLYACVGLVWLQGPLVVDWVNDKHNQACLVSSCQQEFQINTPIVINYYLDKRERRTEYVFTFFDQVLETDSVAEGEESSQGPSVLLGFFTPDRRFRKRKPVCPQNLGRFLPSTISVYPVDIRCKGEYPELIVRRHQL